MAYVAEVLHETLRVSRGDPKLFHARYILFKKDSANQCLSNQLFATVQHPSVGAFDIDF